MTMVATIHIPRGDKLSQFYGNAEIGTRERQLNQMTNYFFSCKCERCGDPTELGSWVSAVKCHCSVGYLLPRDPLDQESIWECAACEGTESYNPFVSERVEEVKEEARVLMINVQGIGEKIKDFSLGSRVITKIESILKKHSGVTVHPNHYALLPLKFKLLHALFNTNNPGLPDDTRTGLCAKTMELIDEYLPVYNILFPGLTPERGQ